LTDGMRGVLRLGLLAILVSLVLGSCGSPTVKGPLRTQLLLRTRRAVPGQLIKGTFVVINPGSPFNLTQLAHPAGELSPDHCRPAFQVYLASGPVNNESGFTMNCVNGSFVIAHGTTQLPFTARTDYSRCTTTGIPTPDFPVCPASRMSPLPEFPPLPPGSYEAMLVWSDVVPLPPPKPVSVVLAVRQG
jgi:hypothetical protein